MTPLRPNRPTVRTALAVLALGLLTTALTGCGGDDGPEAQGEQPGFAGYTRDPAPSVAEVQLPDADGEGTVDFVAADGAEPAVVTLAGADEIEVALGDDHYRLPATMKAAAR